MYATSIQALLPPTAEMRGALYLDSVLGWRTSGSQLDKLDKAQLDSIELSEHLNRCRRSRGPLFQALCLADTIEKFLAPRVVTIIVVVALLVETAFAVL